MEVGGQHHAPTTLSLGKTTAHCTGGWAVLRASEQVQKISPPPGFNSCTIQPITSCYTNYTLLAFYAEKTWDLFRLKERSNSLAAVILKILQESEYYLHVCRVHWCTHWDLLMYVCVYEWMKTYGVVEQVTANPISRLLILWHLLVTDTKTNIFYDLYSFTGLSVCLKMEKLIHPREFEVKGTSHFPDSDAPRRGRMNADKQVIAS